MTQSQSQQNQQKKELEAAYDEKVKAGDISHIEGKRFGSNFFSNQEDPSHGVKPRRWGT